MSSSNKAPTATIIASKIGVLPISIPQEMDVKIDDANEVVSFSFKNQSVSQKIHSDVSVKIEDNQLHVELKEGRSLSKKHWGTMRSLIQNYVTGLQKGHEKKLTLQGVGYRVTASGSKIELSLGFSHSVLLRPNQKTNYR